MNELLCELASFILDNPELKNKKDYEIYNLWFSQKKHLVNDINDVKLILEYINNIKNIPSNWVADSLERSF